MPDSATDIRTETPPAAYRMRLAPALFDWMVRWIYWPHAIGDVRAQIVECLALRPGLRVLEPGAGTGGLTRLMVQAGAEVTCVERAPVMLERLRARVPAARCIVGSAGDFESDVRFERVLLALFLHEQGHDERLRILNVARTHLAPGGAVVVADTFAPDAGLARVLWRAFLRTFEPATVLEVADGALEGEIAEAGLAIRSRESLAGGRLRVWVATDPSTTARASR